MSGTDDVDPQWPQILRQLHADGFYVLGPQAKGKIERPYRWLHDRIVRTCALERISSLQDAHTVLLEEVQRYNYRQVHSTIGEIPRRALRKGPKDRKKPFPTLCPTPIL